MTVETSRQRAVWRRALLILLAGIVLGGFVVELGNYRRRNWAMIQATWYAGQLAERLGEERSLPLNLEVEMRPESLPQLGAQLRVFRFLSREQARVLRKAEGRLPVAWTATVVQTLRRDGAVVIFFEHEHFSTEWVLAAAFADQRREINRRLRELDPAVPLLSID